MKKPLLISDMQDWLRKQLRTETYWHYTAFPTYMTMLNAGGELLPRSAAIQRNYFDPNERPAIYFLDESGAADYWRDVISHHAQRARGFWVRIAYTGPLVPISSLSFLLGKTPAASSFWQGFWAGRDVKWSADDRERLREMGRHVYVSFDPIKFEDFAAVELTKDDGATWQRVFENASAPRVPAMAT